MHLSLWIALLVSLFSFGLQANNLETGADLPEEVRGSLCLIRADHKLIVVKETFSRKLSLPGGTIDKGEDPKVTAERETWEETGLIVNAVRQLGVTGKGVVYECVPQSRIVVFSHRQGLKGKALPAWFAPHFGIEVKDVLAIEPLLVTADEYRYPEQWSTIVNWTGDVTSYPVNYVDNLINNGNAWQQFELDGLNTLYQWADEFEAVAAFIGFIILVSKVIISPMLLGLSLVVAAWRGNIAIAQKLLFIQLLTVLMAVVAKFGFTLPAPSQFLGLVTEQNIGLSFPSVRAALLAATTTFLFSLVSLNRIIKIVMGLTLAFACLGMFVQSQVFLTDILFGSLLGYFVTRHFFKLAIAEQTQLSLLTQSRMTWLLLSVVAGGFASVWYATSLLQVTALAATAFLVMNMANGRRLNTVRIHPIPSVICILFGYLLSEFIHSRISYSAFYSLVVEVTFMPVILLCIYVLTLFSNSGRYLTRHKGKSS